MSGKRFNLEMTVGLFMIVGLLCFGYLAVKLGEVNLFGNDRYLLQARFTSISGIKSGAPVEIAGVRVGEVSGIDLDGNEYEAVVDLSIAGNVKVQEDAIASIRSTGIIGDKFVQITPGGSEDYLEGGMEIVETESSVSLEELISKYIFEK